ncbi:MAG: ABC transporter ATP-binding protein [Firmicutes bacterium]|nr:ABC transporter ATP-binding protein [Bacillota bacterium]
MDKLLEFREAVLGYGGRAILPPINFDILKGDFTGVVGPNGAGKTTFLRAVLSLIKPISGKIVRKSGIRFGYVPQKETINEMYPVSAKDIVMMSRFPMSGAILPPGKKDREAVAKALEMVKITDIANKRYGDMSGGQKQRTLIARALAPEPDVLILDEPTNGMDILAEKTMVDLVENLNRENGITVIMVTHILNLVANRAGRLLLLNNHVKSGTTQELLSTESLTETYKGNISVIEGPDGKKYISAV